MSHLRDAVIFITGGKTRHTIFFGIHTHRAELQNLKLLTIFGQTNLLIERRAAIRLDCNGCNQEERAENDQRNQRDHNIHCPFHKQVFRACHIPAHPQNRQMEHVHRL